MSRRHRESTRTDTLFPYQTLFRSRSRFRRLNEEPVLNSGYVQILGVTSGWLRYRLPQRYLRRSRGRICIGQKQRWFALRLTSSEAAIRFDACDKPEFDGWRWGDSWLPLDEVDDFTRDVYHAALRAFAPLVSVMLCDPPKPE